MNKKWYKVALRSLNSSSTNTVYCSSYVVATNKDEAVSHLKSELKSNTWELDKVDLLDKGFKMSKKLYRVTLRGLNYSSTGITYGSSYVVAANTDEAVLKVQSELLKSNIGSDRDRELDKVELLADTLYYPNCGTVLYLA